MWYLKNEVQGGTSKSSRKRADPFCANQSVLPLQQTQDWFEEIL